MQEFKVDKHNTIVAESENTRSGFRHVVILMRDGHEVDRTKVTYINRTWESFPFETALQKILGKHPEISPKTKSKFFDRASGRHHEEVESQFRTTAAVASLGNLFGKTEKEKADWKTRMLKAGIPELMLPEDWEQLSDKDKNARLDKIIEMMGKTHEAKKKKNLEDVS
jgi:hypothetical protein